MSVLKPRPVSSKQFTWRGTYAIGDISDTHGFGRVYDDAVDEGLTVVSERTGRQVTFVVTEERRDAEGDIQLWELRSVCRNFTMTLFND